MACSADVAAAEGMRAAFRGGHTTKPLATGAVRRPAVVEGELDAVVGDEGSHGPAALSAFNAEADPKKRGALWGNVQQVVFTEVPYIRVGNFNSLTARSAKLDGYVAMPWPFFWNTDCAGTWITSGSFST